MQIAGAKPRILEQGPRLVLGEESGKQSGAVPPGAENARKRVTGQARGETMERTLHGQH
ncbi:hypothetical protein [Pseudacidobacterium ailaaui]|uniref:hypothetical protein n=1 Tax=Pseudacidobacterium ailaaui TaxID=1382359 RepID=UPI0012DCCA1F|nr:hypothetical protein [Pseudacidobacterium ailaaui]